MHLFYTENIDVNGGVLPETEARHCLKSMRLKLGDSIKVTDGKNNLFTAVILDDREKNCTLSVVDVKKMPHPLSFRLHIAIAPTKNESRTEWFIEKAVEIGISEITCLQCEHSERIKLKNDRIERLIISAMKQSLHYEKPVFNGIVDFYDFINNYSNKYSQKAIACCENEKNKIYIEKYCKPEKDTLILIGPEGDFSHEEVDAAVDSGFHIVSLGESRLRTETAALVACTSLHYINRKT